MSIKSPCIKLCQLDFDLGICTGCGRTVEEITSWSQMSDAQREEVMGQLSRRLLDVPR